jgi:hypothetical protein
LSGESFLTMTGLIAGLSGAAVQEIIDEAKTKQPKTLPAHGEMGKPTLQELAARL